VSEKLAFMQTKSKKKNKNIGKKRRENEFVFVVNA
jgi:hypothetical protein